MRPNANGSSGVSTTPTRRTRPIALATLRYLSAMGATLDDLAAGVATDNLPIPRGSSSSGANPG